METATERSAADPASTRGELRRPRLLPGLAVLRRMAGETQIGTDPRHAAVVSGVPESVAPVLRMLDGGSTVEELVAKAAGADHAVLNRILTGLVDLGLIEDAACPDWPADGIPSRLTADCTAWALRSGQPRVEVSERRHRAVVVRGNSRIAIGMATLLGASGIGWVHTIADGVVGSDEIGCGYVDSDIGLPRSVAAERAVLAAAPGTRTGRLPARRQPDLVVLTDVIVPDPALSGALCAAGIPHLLVRASEGIGVVGPLVIPGRTCCLRCVDLHRTDADPCWPALATQLAARAQPSDLATATATAAFAVGQVLRALHQSGFSAHEPPTWGAAVEIDVFEGQSSRTTWPPHPRCVCGGVRAASG